MSLCFVTILTSCTDRQGIEFIIYNNSQLTIDSVIVTTTNLESKIRLDDIKPGLDKIAFLNMDNISKVDGDYSVEIITDSITYKNKIGYYTNGFPSERKIEIWFSQDSIKYKPTLRAD